MNKLILSVLLAVLVASIIVSPVFAYVPDDNDTPERYPGYYLYFDQAEYPTLPAFVYVPYGCGIAAFEDETGWHLIGMCED